MQTVNIILNFLRVLRSRGRASESENALPARSLNSLGYQPTVPGEGCPNDWPSAGAFEPEIEPHSLIYLFSISTGSASGGCTFTFTSAMRVQFPPFAQETPRVPKQQVWESKNWRRQYQDGARGLLPPVAAGPSLSVGFRWPRCACSASLAGPATSYSCFPEYPWLSDKQGWFLHSELERHSLALSKLCEGIFLEALGKELQEGTTLPSSQEAGAELVARKPGFRQSPAQLPVGGARLAASVVTRTPKERLEAMRGGLPGRKWRQYLRGPNLGPGGRRWRKRRRRRASFTPAERKLASLATPGGRRRRLDGVPDSGGEWAG